MASAQGSGKARAPGEPERARNQQWSQKPADIRRWNRSQIRPVSAGGGTLRGTARCVPSQSRLLLALGCAWPAGCRGAAGRSAGARRARRGATGEVRSNITRADYAGSRGLPAAATRASTRLWLDSPMHRMTRDLHQTQIRAPFYGRNLRVPQRLRHDGANRRRTLHAPARGALGKESLFHVTKVIGGRYREDFVGAEVDPSAPLSRPDRRRAHPAGLVPRVQRRVALQGLLGDGPRAARPGARRGLENGLHLSATTRRRRCRCLLDDVYGPARPLYQGSVSVELPDNKRPRYVVRDEAALKAALGAELEHLGRSARHRALRPEARPDGRASTRTRDAFAEKDLVELGIGCEACHGGAREHVLRPDAACARRSRCAAISCSVTTPTGGEPTHAQDINRTCAKCHTVLFSRYPYTWEGRSRRHDSGRQQHQLR